MPLTEESGRLIGTWQLISIQFELADTGECFDVYGPHPLGFLILTDRGRLMGMVTSADREAPRDKADGAALFESMMAYSGKYRFEGEDKFITSVDLAWHPAWVQLILFARPGRHDPLGPEIAGGFAGPS